MWPEARFPHLLHTEPIGTRRLYSRLDRPRTASDLRGPPITYTSALLAIVVGIVHAGLAPVIEVGGVHPNLLLVGVVVVTATFGFPAGILWAFAGGVTANLLVSAPLGSIPLGLLLVAALVAGGGRILGRLVWLYPILAAVVGSVLFDVVTLTIARMVDEPIRGGIPLALVIPAAVLNAAIAGLVLVPTRIAALRSGAIEERPAW